MKFPQSFIEEIRGRIRVSEIVGRAIPLRRAGREFHALCPFHKEKSPSFTVNDEKGFFHCFGCGAHGDVIGFTMDYEHLGYREAVEKLATVAGLNVPRETKSEVERERKTQSLQHVMEIAASWFETQLENTGEGEVGRRYLAERGLKPETRAKFRIGYAPADRDLLARTLKAQGITEAQMVEAGLLIALEDRAPYSRFRRRLMFPIRDRKSRVIAFGGRVLPGEPNADAPKYLNSPETPLFHKGRQLFNLDLARRPAMESNTLLVCEGYMDVIALSQAGMLQAVAPLGTAITEEQLKLCWMMADAPTLCLDGDTAGQRAMGRAMELALPLLMPGKTLSIAVLPKGEDPDSLVTAAGKEGFEQVLRAAQPLAGILWQQVMEVGAATPEARAAQEHALMQKVAAIKHPLVQHYYKQYMRDRLREAGQVRFEKGRFSPRKPTAIPPPLAPKDKADVASASKLVALAIAHPALLMEASAEEFWLTAPMVLGWQQQAHHLITSLHGESTAALEHHELWRELKEEIAPDALAEITQVMEMLGVDPARDELQRSSHAERWWGQVVNDIERTHLTAELKEAEAALGADLTEENLERVNGVRAQIEANDRERSRFYREDPLMGAV